ncbi:MAG: phosphoribosylglycinamide synthetase C domain-containing protein [Thiomicrorhabdus sp.]|nr:phosphoribosylglycinamide synthetase C domain-containing protein [Thiomicrorhabdus sp.]
MGNTVAEAQKAAYEVVDKIHWNNVYFRKDIGFKAIK